MWAFSVGTIWGIEVRVHVLFLAFMGILALLTGIGHGVVAAINYLVLTGFVLAFVFLHELGHCVAARHFSIEVKDITLWPFGGIATMENMAPRPAIELRIAIAGPLVNFGLALLLAPVALVAYFFAHSLFFAELAAVNVILFSFNLLPAFPLDGGRIYRAWQAGRVGLKEATRQTLNTSIAIAILLCVVGIVYPWCFILALIIILAGRQELAMSEYFQDLADQDDLCDCSRGPDRHHESVQIQEWLNKLWGRHWRS